MDFALCSAYSFGELYVMQVGLLSKVAGCFCGLREIHVLVGVV